MNPYTELFDLVSSEHRLLITREAYTQLISLTIPSTSDVSIKRTSFFLDDRPSYIDQTSKVLADIKAREKKKCSTVDFLQVEYSDSSLPSGSIAYHRVFGPVLSDSFWYFSSKQFVSNILESEANPKIASHLIHISSGGGEAWYLDVVSQTLSQCTKPIVVLIEKVCASAAYYIACHGTKIFSLTQNDIIGCIGTMVSAVDFKPYFEKAGIKFIEQYAHQSDLKNKKYRDLEQGSPEQYISEELDPLCAQFIDTVRSHRAPLSSLGDDSPILRGETFSASISVDNGLIDSIASFATAIEQAYKLGQDATLRHQIINSINQ